MKFLIKKYLFFILFLTTSISFAQTSGGFCDPGLCVAADGVTCVTCDVPIDGGASLLLIAGGVYGVNKIRKYRKIKVS